MITAFTSVAKSVGANRIIFGGDFTSPAGNPELPLEREKAYRKKILEKALQTLQEDIDSPKIYTVDDEKDGEKND